MHRNLITNSFAIAKHDKSSILRKMFTQFFLSIILAVSFQSTVFGDITQADLDKLGSQLIETTYGKLTIIEIDKHPKREEILAGMTRSAKSDFLDWKEQAAQERLKEQEKRAEEAQAKSKSIHTGIASKSNLIINVYRNDLKNGKKLSNKHKEMIEFLLDPQFKLRDLGMTQETFEGLTELLRNPKNFE